MSAIRNIFNNEYFLMASMGLIAYIWYKAQYAKEYQENDEIYFSNSVKKIKKLNLCGSYQCPGIECIKNNETVCGTFKTRQLCQITFRRKCNYVQNFLYKKDGVQMTDHRVYVCPLVKNNSYGTIYFELNYIIVICCALIELLMLALLVCNILNKQKQKQLKLRKELLS